MIETFEFARDCFIDGNMTAGDVQDYLYVFTFNSHTIDKLLEDCQEYMNNLETVSREEGEAEGEDEDEDEDGDEDGGEGEGEGEGEG